MGKILVKAPQAMMSPSGEIQFLYGGGQGKGGDRGSLPARVLGGLGKVAGGALGATGRHQSIQSLLGGIQGGAATGEQAGRWAGGFADKLPGGRTRAARRKIRGERDDAYTQMRAGQKESRNKRDRALDAYNLQMDEQKRGAKQAQRAEDWESNREQRNREMLENMTMRQRMRNQLKDSSRSRVDNLVSAAADQTGASKATTRRALGVMDQEQSPDPFEALGFPPHNSADTMRNVARSGQLSTQGSPPMHGAGGEEARDMAMGYPDASSYNTTGPARPDGPINPQMMAQIIADLQDKKPQEVARIEEMGKQPAPIDAAMGTFNPQY